MTIILTGDWDKLDMLERAQRHVEPVMKKVIIRQAHWLRGKMLGKEGIDNPALAPLSPWTIAGGRRGTKPLQDSGTLRASIGVIHTPHGAFVGVRRKAKGKRGMSAVNLAKLHEKGATFNVTVTKKMRGFLIAITMKRFGSARAPAVGSTLTIRIPARPFITPVLDKYAKKSVIMPRIQKDFAKQLSKAMNVPFTER